MTILNRSKMFEKIEFPCQLFMYTEYWIGMSNKFNWSFFDWCWDKKFMWTWFANTKLTRNMMLNFKKNLADTVLSGLHALSSRAASKKIYSIKKFAPLTFAQYIYVVWSERSTMEFFFQFLHIFGFYWWIQLFSNIFLLNIVNIPKPQ